MALFEKESVFEIKWLALARVVFLLRSCKDAIFSVILCYTKAAILYLALRQ